MDRSFSMSTETLVSSTPGLLTNLKVLDLTWAAAGPVVTTFLAFLGADVVKVEHSSRPDLMRVSDKQYGYGDDRGVNESPLFNELAADKRSIELDLNQPADLAVAAELAGVADVFVENMRPGKIEKLGLSYAELSAKNPGLIMCSVSGTGRSSVEGQPGYAPIFWAEGGGAWLTGWPERPPGLVRGPIDLHAAAFATLGVLALLRRRGQTGQGGYIDCSAIEAVSSTLGAHLMEAQLALPEPVRQGNRALGTLVNDVFPCRGNDQWAAITLRDADDVRKLVDVMNHAFGRRVSPDIMAAGEGAWAHLAEQTRDLEVLELVEKLSAAGLRAARSNSMLQAMSDEHLYSRGILQEIFHDTIGRQVIIGLPWLIGGQAYKVRGPAPVLGAHNEPVIRSWLKREA
jgi:benzylsuccinate CoA-transferase BbsF subunit